jgi:hypothetical protein
VSGSSVCLLSFDIIASASHHPLEFFFPGAQWLQKCAFAFLTLISPPQGLLGYVCQPFFGGWGRSAWKVGNGEVDGWVGNYGMIWVMCEELLKGMGRGWEEEHDGLKERRRRFTHCI